MKYKVIILVIIAWLFIFISYGYAEFENRYLGARARAMGNTFTGIADDVYASYFNPGGLIQMENLQVTALHTKLFNMGELKMDYIAAAQPLPRLAATLGVSWLRLGTSTLYSEQTFCLSIGRRVYRGMGFGINIKSLNSYIKNTPDAWGLSIDVGFFWKINSMFACGLMVKDVNSPMVNEEVPQTSTIGFSVRPSSRMIIGLDVTKKTNRQASLHIGQEFQISKNFAIRAGYQTDPQILTAGFGFHLYNWYIDYAFESHNVLDNTHTVAVKFDFSTANIKFPHIKLPKLSSQPQKQDKKKVSDNRKLKVRESALAKSLRKHFPKIKRQGNFAIRVVNVNKATQQELQMLPSINRTIANNIVIYRYIHGPFKKKSDLRLVPKLTPEIYKKIQKFVEVN